MDMAMMGPQATPGFQAPEPYVPESAKAAGALYEAGIAPSVVNAVSSEPAPFDPVAYRNQFKPGGDDSGLASIAQPASLPQKITNFDESSVKPKGYETGGPTVEFIPQRGGPASRGQQMPSFYQQPMMPQSFNPMGYGPMGMFMNPYGGGLGGMAYSFQNPNINPNISAPLPFYATGSLPLYGQGGQFQAGQYQAPEPKQMTRAIGSFIMPYV